MISEVTMLELSVSVSAAILKTQIAGLPLVRSSLQVLEKCGLMARMGRLTGAGRNPFKWLKQAAIAATAASVVLFGMTQMALAAPAATTTTLAITAGGISATLVPQGAQVTLTATVVAGATPVTLGTVNFCEGTHCTDIHRIGTAQLTSAGMAVFSFTPGSGSHNYTAEFRGSTGYSPSTTASASALSVIVLGGPGPSATTSIIAPSGSAGNYTLTATVSGTSLNGLTGAVSFLDTNNADFVVGSGTLSAPVIGTGLSVVSTIAPSVNLVGDFNGDGIPDLVTLIHDSVALTDTVLVEIGNGDGTFTAAASQIALTQGVAGMALGDFNGDGKLDLAVVGISATGVPTDPDLLFVLLGNGDGTFTQAAPIPLSNNDLSVAAGDFNNDGNLDLAITNSANNNVSILLGNGDGTFSLAATQPSTGSGPNGIVVGDINNDGNLDLVTPNSNDPNTYTVLLGNGDGTFTSQTYLVSGAYQVWSVLLGDFNGDGKLDLAVTDLGVQGSVAGQTFIQLGAGDGTFADPVVSLTSVQGPVGLALGDFNGDGILDLAIQDGLGNPTYPAILEIGVGDGTFIDGPSQDVAAGNLIVAGDLNGDGKTDLVVIDPNSQTDVLLTGVTQTSTAAVSGISVVGAAAAKHQVAANYVGDTNNNPSTSGPTPLDTQPAVPAVVLTANPASSVYGQAVTLTATLSPYVVGSYTTNGDAVVFYNGVTILGTGTLSGGVATFSVSSLAAGSASLTASYTGDADFSGQASSALSYSVAQAPQTINFPAPASPVVFGVAPITLSANGGGSSNPVIFSVVSGPGSITGSTLTITGVGTVVVAANQAGNANYTAATAVQQSIVVNKGLPIITWSTPAAITYGTVLSATQLNASATPSAGTFAYTPALGSVPTAGSKTLSVTFTPTDSTNYTTATSTVTLVVNKATPAITWGTPAAISYGTPLSAAQLNATSTTPGTFAYTPALGAVLTVGSKTLSVTFTPTDATDYTTETSTVTLVVNKATPAITWATPAAIPYGTPLSAAQLNASSTTPGTFVYTPASGTVLAAGNQTLSVTFTPTDAADYNTATSTVTLVVGKTTPSITWATPAAISYGTPLTAAQLNATSTTPGTFVYSPALGTVLTAGSQTLSVTFTPTDLSTYTPATSTVTLVVNKANPTITWGAPAGIAFGTALSATQLNASSTTPGTFTYTPALGIVPAVGSQTLSVTLTPTDTANYSTATSTVTLVVTKAAAAITWGTPAAITYGTALSATQLNASSTPAAGTFAYTPAAGAVLAAGSQTLSVTFTPTDAADYAAATASVTQQVNQASQTITFTPPTSPVIYGVSSIALIATGGASNNPVIFSVVSGPGSISGNSLTITGVGTVVVAANQAGNSNYTAATQVTHSIVVNLTSQTITFTPPATVTFGVAPIALSATGGPSGNPVTFSVISGPGLISGNSLTITGAGTIVVAANQAGNSTYSAAPAIQQSIVVNKAASGVSLASNVNPVLSQNSITLTATVISTAGAPTGTVAFADGATPLGTGTLSASGVATLAITTLSVGSHSITAAYTGDSNFSTSTSGVITQVVEDFSLAISSGAGGTTVTVTKGSAGVFTFTLSPTAPATTFPAAVTLAATGLPAGATATFSPTSIAAGAGSTTVTLTIQTSATAFNVQPAMPNSAKPVEVAQNGSSKLPFLALALILLPFAGRMRRTGKKLGRTLPLLLLLVAGIAAVGVSGCGGTSSLKQNPVPVSYTIQITATSGTLSHSTNVTLIVE
jgi:hypothetical protein